VLHKHCMSLLQSAQYNLRVKRDYHIFLRLQDIPNDTAVMSMHWR